MINSLPVASPYVKRLHYMDNLRAGVMLLGIVFHAALAYSTTVHQIWPTADTSVSRVVDFFAWLSHAFRMPLFFLIAGFFAHLLVSKRGLAAFLKNRALRIALPFVVFWPLVGLFSMGILWLAIAYLNVNTALLEFIKHSIDNPAAANSPQPIGTGHLWFLYYLAIFCLFAALLQRYLPCRGRIALVALSPFMLLVVWPMLTCASLFWINIPHPPPSQFVPSLSALSFYGLFFFLGWLYYLKQNMLDSLSPFWWLLLLVCGVAYYAFFSLLPLRIPLQGISNYYRGVPEMTSVHLTAVLASTVLAWYASFLCLIFARKYFNFENKFIRYFSDASYWLYIIHLPVVFFMQVLLHLVKWPIIIELSISICVTLAVGLLTYDKWVRYSRIGVLLNGRRH